MSNDYKVEIKGEKSEAKEKTCRITVVRAGFPDSYIKIKPATHEEEKIWVDTREGDERWKMIERTMHLNASRNTSIPKPLPAHSDMGDLRTPDFKESDIPVVTLENYTLTK
mgnify:CR=1 FL=1